MRVHPQDMKNDVEIGSQGSGGASQAELPQVGQVIDPHVHFFYADQSWDEARDLMADLGLAFLPVVDRTLRVVSILYREVEEPTEVL